MTPAPTAPPVPLRGAFGVAPSIEVCAPAEIAALWSGVAAPGWDAEVDGARFVAEVGRAGDHRFVHAGRSLHHLTADGRELRCAWLADAPPGPERWRVTLDSVLFSVALLRGHEALHAGAVAVTVAGATQAVAVSAGAGGGKSTLLAELVRRGRPLVTDDVAVLDGAGAPTAALLVHPGPPLMTVPAAAAHDLGGRELAALGDERWLTVDVVDRPLPLAAIVLLDRGPGATDGDPRIEPVGAPLIPLLHALLRFPRTPERERARFELASRLAERPVWILRADPHASPAALADCLTAATDRLPAPARDRPAGVEEPR